MSTVTGTIAGHGARFMPIHREFSGTAEALHVMLSVPMSYEDVAAVLYVWVQAGYPIDDLVNDPPTMHELVLEGLLCKYPAFLAARREITGLAPGTPDWERYIRLQTTVFNIYSAVPPVAGARRLEVAR